MGIGWGTPAIRAAALMALTPGATVGRASFVLCVTSQPQRVPTGRWTPSAAAFR